jgi:hypothetical protein
MRSLFAGIAAIGTLGRRLVPACAAVFATAAVEAWPRRARRWAEDVRGRVPTSALRHALEKRGRAEGVERLFGLARTERREDPCCLRHHELA